MQTTPLYEPSLRGSRVNKVMRVIFGTDMRLGHPGLTKAAKDAGIKVSEIQIGDYLVFINSKKTHVKIFTANNTIAHFKHPENRQINLKVISLIPRFFNGSEFKFTEAMREVLLKEIRE